VRTRRGFTPIEPLAATASIAVLIAILPPAVQATGGAARRSWCVNDLKQLGLAVDDGHEQQSTFPMRCGRGMWSPDVSHERSGSASVWKAPASGPGTFAATQAHAISNKNMYEIAILGG
jgi:hypothetical protein